MPVVIECESCATKLRVADEHQGKTVRCPRCKKPIAVPDAPPEVTEDDTLDTPLRVVRPGEDAFEGLQVSEKIRKAVNAELEEDEQIIWVGQGVREEFVLAPWKCYAAAGVFGGIGLFFLIVIIAIVVGTQAWVLGILFLLGWLIIFGGGCGALAAAGFFNDAWAAGRPCYFLTDRRVMVYESRKITSAAASFIPKMRRQNKATYENAGNLIIPFKSTGIDATIRFDTVENVEAVEQLVKDVLIDGKRP
jgi:predicted Zn finger-like uncharacterized protein